MLRDRQVRINVLFALPFIIIAIVGLGWFGYQRTLYTFAEQRTSVHITRQPVGHLGALDVTVTNAETVQKIYLGLKSLKPFPNGIHSCPADFGVEYTLTFKSGNQTVVTAYADPNGCETIRLSTGQTLWGITNTPKGALFWNTIAKALDLPDGSALGGPT